MRKGRLWALIAVIMLVIVSLACGDSTPTAAPPDEPAAEEATEAPAAEEPPAEEEAEEPQEPEEAEPTEVPPTEAPEPTATPEPTDVPEPPAEPIALVGEGDSIVDVDIPFSPAVAYVTGNAEGRFFAVTSYGADGDAIDLLVNTTDPYEGYRPLDLMSDEKTTRFEVQAEGAWTIDVLPLAPEYLADFVLEVPGTLSGSGDAVIILAGSTPDLANITGNADGRFFAVASYGGFFPDLMVNTTEPYEGTTIVDSEAEYLEVQAVGAWEIEITEK